MLSWLFLLFLPQVEPKRLINIALHAQVEPSNGMIVGSVMTTEGLKYAFLDNPSIFGDDSEIGSVEVFYPFSYGSSFFSRSWDVIIIEGWFLSINSFIHEVRRAGRANANSLSPFGPIILFWCLDPIFPGLNVISSLDLDGILSNSHRAIAEFNQYNPDLPTSYVMLASRPSEIEIIDESMVNTDAVSNAVLMATNKIVYVGSMGGLESKSLLAPLLREAMKANLTSCHQCKSPLVVFGAGWDNSQEFKHIWGGLLPHAPGALSRVYDVAFAVIGATMDDQRDYGMVNNRVFEVLASGALFISEHFDELEDLLGKWSPQVGGSCCYVKEVGMLHTCIEEATHSNNVEWMLEEERSEDEEESTSRVWKYLLQLCEGDAKCARKKLIGSAHTYKHRLRTIVNTVLKIVKDRSIKDTRSRLRLSKETESLTLDPLHWLNSLSLKGKHDDLFGFHAFHPNYLATGDVGGPPLRMIDSLNLLTPPCLRPKCPRVALVFDTTDKHFTTIEFASTFLPSIASVGSSYSLHWVDAGSIQRHWQPPYSDKVDDNEGTDMQRRGHWYLDAQWANSYDMIWALGCPGSLTDIAVRSLPAAVTMGGAPRLRCLLLLESQCMVSMASHLRTINPKYSKQLKLLRQSEERLSTITSNKELASMSLDDSGANNEDMENVSNQRRRVGADGYRKRISKLVSEVNRTRAEITPSMIKDHRKRHAHMTHQLHVYDMVYATHQIDQLALSKHFQLKSLQYIHGFHPPAFKQAVQQDEGTIRSSSSVVFLGEIDHVSQLKRKHISETVTQAFRCLVQHKHQDAEDVEGGVGSCLSIIDSSTEVNKKIAIRLLITGVSMEINVIDEVSHLAAKAWQSMIETSDYDMAWREGVQDNWPSLPPIPSKHLPCLHIEHRSHSDDAPINCPITLMFLSVGSSRIGSLFSLLHSTRCIFLALKYDDKVKEEGPMKEDQNYSMDIDFGLKLIDPLAFYHDDWLMDLVSSAKHTDSRVFVLEDVISETFPVLSVDHYATSLIMGITRGYTLGRTRSAVSFSLSLFDKNDQPNSPARILHSGHNRFDIGETLDSLLKDEEGFKLEREDRLWVAMEMVKIEVNFQFEEFDLGRDGSVCLFANQHMVTCILQPQLQLDLIVNDLFHDQRNLNKADEVSGVLFEDMEFDVVFHCELKSSIYADVLRSSKPITVRLKRPHHQLTDYSSPQQYSSRRSMSWGFSLSQFGNQELSYIHEISTGKPLNIILNENNILFLKFTKYDNLEELAFEFVKRYEMHLTMGMGCQVGDIICMSNTLADAMRHLIQDHEILNDRLRLEEENRQYQMLLKLEEDKNHEREKMLLLQRTKGEQSELNKQVEAESSNELFRKSEINRQETVKSIEKSMAHRLKQKLGKALADAKQGQMADDNEKQVLVGEDGSWEFR